MAILEFQNFGILEFWNFGISQNLTKIPKFQNSKFQNSDIPKFQNSKQNPVNFLWKFQKFQNSKKELTIGISKKLTGLFGNWIFLEFWNFGMSEFWNLEFWNFRILEFWSFGISQNLTKIPKFQNSKFQNSDIPKFQNSKKKSSSQTIQSIFWKFQLSVPFWNFGIFGISTKN